MNQFEQKLQVASKPDELVQALYAEQISSEQTSHVSSVGLGVVKVESIGGRYRAETLAFSGEFIKSLSLTDFEIFRAFEKISENFIENVMIGGKIWNLYRLHKSGDRAEILVVNGHPIAEAIFNRFAHEWRWFKRLEEAEDQLLKDELTGLFNTRYLDMVMDQELLRCQRFNVPFSVVFIDLDNFKSVNDRYGHLVGSDLLKTVAKSLLQAVRESDSLVRYGGDEFVGLLLGTNQNKALTVAERMRLAVENTILNIGNFRVGVTASFGIASFPENGSTRNALLAAADKSMYVGKNQGKNCVIRPVLEPFRGKAHG